MTPRQQATQGRRQSPTARDKHDHGPGDTSTRPRTHTDTALRALQPARPQGGETDPEQGEGSARASPPGHREGPTPRSVGRGKTGALSVAGHRRFRARLQRGGLATFRDASGAKLLLPSQAGLCRKNKDLRRRRGRLLYSTRIPSLHSPPKQLFFMDYFHAS